MKWNWSKVLAGAKKGIEIAAPFEPHIAIVNALVHNVQDAMPDAPGADKKKTVEDLSDAVLESFPGLTEDQKNQFRALRSEYIDLVVAEQKIIARTLESRAKLAALLASFKAPEAAPGGAS